MGYGHDGGTLSYISFMINVPTLELDDSMESFFFVETIEVCIFTIRTGKNFRS